jgi:adenylate kinase family enzyme
MKRIVIIGSSGAGKSTLARILGEILKIEVLHLDKIYWQPNWTEPPKDKWEQQVAEILKKDSWIIDGNFGGTMEMRLKACDTAILLDLPRTICVRRIIKRWLVYRRETRPDMADGCDEKFDWKFLKWVWRFPQETKPKVEARLKKVENEKTIIRLKSIAEVEKFISNVKQIK